MTVLVSDLSPIVDRILGRSFGWGACGPTHFSCLGLWLHVVERATGIRIDDPYAAAADGKVAALWERVARIDGYDRLQPLDVIYQEPRLPKDLPGVSFVESPFWAVASSIRLGVHRLPLQEALRPLPVVYRLKELV